MSKYSIFSLSDTVFVNSIKDIAVACSKFKMDVYKASLMNKEMDEYKSREFLGKVNSFLRMYEDYGIDLQSNMKTSKGTENVYTITYAEVRPFIFANYDYASVLMVMDGITQGVSKDKFKSADDIADFVRFSVKKAFKDRPDEAGKMLDEVISGSLEMAKSTTSEVSLYNSVKNKNLFDNNDRTEIFKSIEKVVDFLTYELISTDTSIGKAFAQQSLKLAAINNIVEYMKTTLTAFAVRVYVISKYAIAYITSAPATETTKPVTEATKVEKPSKGEPEKIRNIELHLMKETDESIARDIEHYDELIDRFKEWGNQLGEPATLLSDTDRGISCTRGCAGYVPKGNIFYSKFLGNALFDFFGDQYHTPYKLYWSMNEPAIQTNIQRFHQDIKDLTYNGSMGNPAVISPKQDMLNIIRLAEPEKTSIESYTALAADLIFMISTILYNLRHHILEVYSFVQNEENHPKFNNSIKVKCNEISIALRELYKEIAVATLFKARDIEQKINEQKNLDFKRRMEEISIKLPEPMTKKYKDEEPITMPVNPDTSRTITEIYSISDLDTMNMYDEYVKTLPDMEDDIYYSEALNFQVLVNNITALIQGIVRRITTFFQNQKFKLAAKWCEEHQAEFTTSQYTPPMKVNDYAPAGDVKTVDTLTAAISNINLNDINSDEKLTELKKKLYGDMYGIFFNEKNEAQDRKIAKNRYLNKFIYNTDPKAQGSENPRTRELATSEIIQKYAAKWVGIVTNGSELYKSLSQTCNDLNRAITSLKNKVVSFNPTGAAPAAQGTANTQNPPKMDNTQQKTTQNVAGYQQTAPTGTTSNQQNTQQNNSAVYTQQVLTIVLTAVDDIFNTLSLGTIDMVKTSYGYIQEAWSKRVVANNQSQQTQQQQTNAQ